MQLCQVGKYPVPSVLCPIRWVPNQQLWWPGFLRFLLKKNFKWKNKPLVAYNALAHKCSHFIPPQGDEIGIIILILHMKNLSQCECQSNSLFSCSECSLKHHFSQWKTVPQFRIDSCKIQNANLHVRKKQILVKLLANQ